MGKLYIVYTKYTHSPIAIVCERDLADYIANSYTEPCSVYCGETEVSLQELDNHYLWR